MHDRRRKKRGGLVHVARRKTGPGGRQLRECGGGRLRLGGAGEGTQWGWGPACGPRC
jgi:hypothetical protein